MNPQERQMIDSLFQRLAQGAAQAGPRDSEAESLIQQHIQQMPGAPYHMAQAMIVQERALQQAQARLAAYEQAGGAPGSFAGPTAAPPYGYQYPQGQYPPPGQYQAGQYPPQGQAQGGGAGGFLGGAAKIALGVGGGILAADAAMSLAHEIFGPHHSGLGESDSYERGYEQGLDQGRQDEWQTPAASDQWSSSGNQQSFDPGSGSSFADSGAGWGNQGTDTGTDWGAPEADSGGVDDGGNDFGGGDSGDSW
jgi:hypothetical protein